MLQNLSRLTICGIFDTAVEFNGWSMVIDQTALRLGLRIKKNKRALKIEIEKKNSHHQNMDKHFEHQ